MNINISWWVVDIVVMKTYCSEACGSLRLQIINCNVIFISVWELYKSAPKINTENFVTVVKYSFKGN